MNSRLYRTQLTGVPSVLSEDQQSRCGRQEETGPRKAYPDGQRSDDRLGAEIHYSCQSPSSPAESTCEIVETNHVPKGRTRETRRILMKLFFCRSDAQQCLFPVSFVSRLARRDSRTSPRVSRKKSRFADIDSPARIPWYCWSAGDTGWYTSAIITHAISPLCTTSHADPTSRNAAQGLSSSAIRQL